MTKKVIFIAFSMEDEAMRNMLVGQARLQDSPFEFIDMSVNDAYLSDWKDKVRTRIRRSDGVIALVSKSTATSTGQLWEISCAIEENQPLLGLWVYPEDRTRPTALAGVTIVPWSWPALTKFIDGL